MSDEDIEYLKQIVNQKHACLGAWYLDADYHRRIVRVGPNDKENEPGDCGYFNDGTYIALYNVDVDEIWIGLANSIGVWPSRNQAK